MLRVPRDGSANNKLVLATTFAPTVKFAWISKAQLLVRHRVRHGVH